MSDIAFFNASQTGSLSSDVDLSWLDFFDGHEAGSFIVSLFSFSDWDLVELGGVLSDKSLVLKSSVLSLELHHLVVVLSVSHELLSFVSPGGG